MDDCNHVLSRSFSILRYVGPPILKAAQGLKVSKTDPDRDGNVFITSAHVER